MLAPLESPPGAESCCRFQLCRWQVDLFADSQLSRLAVVISDRDCWEAHALAFGRTGAFLHFPVAYPLRHVCFEDLTSQPCCWSVTILACASVRILVTAERLPPVMATGAATAATEVVEW